MVARIRPRWACVLGLILGAFGTAEAQQIPPPAYRSAARDAGVPASVLFAVALQESGTTLRGRLIPWPWTLNIAGVGHRYHTRVQACSALREALKRLPPTRIDVGLGQINVGYHGHRVTRPCELLDPYRNLAIAAAILREHHTSGEDWRLAIGRYHRPAGGTPAVHYRRRVEQHLARISESGIPTATLQGVSP